MKIIKISGEIGWDVTTEDFTAKLDAATGDVSLLVDSTGGDVFVGAAIHQAIKSYSRGKVTAVVQGLAASAASYIILAADEIHIFDNSTYMIHEARVSVYSGTAKELKSKANAIEGINSLYLDAYVNKTGMKREDVALLMDAETYFFGDAIINNGFADKIIEGGIAAKASNTLVSARQRVTACKSNCNSRAANATPPVAHKEPNKFAIEVNQIMEKI